MIKGEQEKVWACTNAEALNRSRFLLDGVTREQIDRDTIKNHHAHVRLASEQMRDAELREAITRSRLLAEAAHRDNLLAR